MKIKIWDPCNEDEADADEVELPCEAVNPDFDWRLQSAVEVFAQKHYREGDHWDQATFHVRVGDDLRVFSAGVDSDPVFHVAEVKAK